MDKNWGYKIDEGIADRQSVHNSGNPSSVNNFWPKHSPLLFSTVLPSCRKKELLIDVGDAMITNGLVPLVPAADIRNSCESEVFKIFAVACDIYGIVIAKIFTRIHSHAHRIFPWNTVWYMLIVGTWDDTPYSHVTYNLWLL
jgi:hypothetical protein